MWLQTKHRNWALLCAFICVLGGAFGFGEEPDERLFRNRTRSTRSGRSCSFTQTHQVLDSLHEDLVSARLVVSGPDAGNSFDIADAFVPNPWQNAIWETSPLASAKEFPSKAFRSRPVRAPPTSSLS